jgi:adenylosuccinate synthase
LPSDIDVWEKVKPVYLEMPGWKSDISEKETFEELPIEA